MAIGVTTWITASRLIRSSTASPEHKWAEELGRMVQVSMIGYAATGAFLSLAYFDLPYNFAAAAVLALHLVRKNEIQRAATLKANVAAANPPQARPPTNSTPDHRTFLRPPQS